MNPIRVSLSDHPVFGNIFQDLAIWVKTSLIIKCFAQLNMPCDISDQKERFQFY